jgi:hypothetical protein
VEHVPNNNNNARTSFRGYLRYNISKNYSKILTIEGVTVKKLYFSPFDTTTHQKYENDDKTHVEHVPNNNNNANTTCKGHVLYFISKNYSKKLIIEGETIKKLYFSQFNTTTHQKYEKRNNHHEKYLRKYKIMVYIVTYTLVATCYVFIF